MTNPPSNGSPQIQIDSSVSNASGQGTTVSSGSTASPGELVQIGIEANGRLTIGGKRKRRVSGKARQLLRTWGDSPQIRKAEQILRRIDNIAEGYPDLDLPDVHISMAVDGSLGISWTIPQISLGFTIDKVPSESTWFVLTGEDTEAVRAYGVLNKVPLNEILGPVARGLRWYQAKNQTEE